MGELLPSTVEEAEEMLIEVHELWRRSPGDGAWPFAGDGPWHLIQPEVGDQAGERSETLLDTGSGRQVQVRKVESHRPRAPLDMAEVDRRDDVTGWLQLIPDSIDRRCVWLATRQLWRGEGRVPWSAIAAWLRYDRTPRALAWRYRLALGLLVCALNGWPMARARQLAVVQADDAA